MLGINSNNSQPSTTKGNVPKKEFPDIDDSEQDQIKDIEFIEYEEFAPKPQTIKNEQPAASHHKVMSNLDLPFSGERILKLKDLPQSSGNRYIFVPAKCLNFLVFRKEQIFFSPTFIKRKSPFRSGSSFQNVFRLFYKRFD